MHKKTQLKMFLTALLRKILENMKNLTGYFVLPNNLKINLQFLKIYFEKRNTNKICRVGSA